MNTTPATAAQNLAAARPGERVVLTAGRYGPLTIPPLVYVSGQPDAIAASLTLRGQAQVSGVSIDGGGVRPGIQAIDGLNGANLSALRIRNVTSAMVFQQDNAAKKPVTDLTLTDIRIRDAADLGIILSKCFRVRQASIWCHRVAVGKGTSYHAWYCDDDCTAAGTGSDLWATECATAFRGTPAVWDRLLAYRCPNGIALGRDFAAGRRVAVIDCPGTGIGVGARNPFLIEDMLLVGNDAPGQKGFEVGAGVICPRMEVRRGVIWGYPSDNAKGMSFNIQSAALDGHGNGGIFFDDLLVASAPVGNPQTGRLDRNYGAAVDQSRVHFLPTCQFATTLTAQVLDPGRRLETFAASLGLPATMDALWDHPFKLADALAYQMEGFGL